MAKKFSEFAAEQREQMGTEGQTALRVFSTAHKIGMTLLEAREKAHMTQVEVAAASGVAQSDVSRIENGQILPTVPTLLKLLDAVGVTLEMHFDDETRVLQMPRVETVTPLPRRLVPVRSPLERVAAFHAGP
jgi:transcriptional regulator with XRE-family HTH domain